jgi:hypothetical protein
MTSITMYASPQRSWLMRLLFGSIESERSPVHRSEIEAAWKRSPSAGLADLSERLSYRAPPPNEYLPKQPSVPPLRPIKFDPIADLKRQMRMLTYGEMMDYARGVLKAQDIDEPDEKALAIVADAAWKWATA